MSSFKRTVLVLQLQLGTVAAGLWKRRSAGFFGTPGAVWQVIKYGVLTVLAQAVLGLRARIIVSLFAWARRIDDRVDGLAGSLPVIGVRSYLADKEELLRYSERLDAVVLPALIEDVLLIDALLTARRLRCNLSSALNRLWACFSYDVGRINTFQVLSQEALIRYAVEQDKAILVPCIALLGGEGATAEEAVEKLQGIFTRIDCLNDLLGDIHQGIVNIPEEAIRKFHISIGHLRLCRSWSDARRVHGFPRWYREEAETLTRTWRSAKQVIEALAFEQLANPRHKFRQRVARTTVQSLLKLFDDLLATCTSRFAPG